MKFIKILTPVILSGFLSFSAFAAENQQDSAKMNEQASEQVAAADNAAPQAAEDKAAVKPVAMNNHKKCTKCKKKHTKGKKAKTAKKEASNQDENSSQQADASDSHAAEAQQPQQEQAAQ